MLLSFTINLFPTHWIHLCKRILLRRGKIQDSLYQYCLAEKHFLPGCPVNLQLTKQLQGLAVEVGISERTLWYALQFYDKYPSLNRFFVC